MDDEIDLRQYLNVLWRRRYIIAGVTLAAILAAVLLSFFVLSPTYEASAILVISGPVLQISNPSSQENSHLTATTIPVLTADNLIPMVHNEVVAADVAGRLVGVQRWKPEALVEKVRLVSVRGTNLLKIIARDSSSSGALAVVNAWAETIVRNVDSLGFQETRRTLSVLETKTSSAELELGRAESSLRDFRASSKIPILEQRVRETVRRIALYESRLVEIEQGGLPIGGEVALQPSGTSYSLTVTSVRDPVQMHKVLAVLKADLASYQAALATEMQRETQLSRQVDLTRSTHALLVRNREELRILLGANAGMVKIAVPPHVADMQVAPRKALNTTLGAVLGLMVGTMLAFVMEYFKPGFPI